MVDEESKLETSSSADSEDVMLSRMAKRRGRALEKKCANRRARSEEQVREAERDLLLTQAEDEAEDRLKR